ncbi:polyprenyl synthetase family protein [Flavobacteriaceae bacterium Ap0902]|nr:polyprenyl synthetase family protein [Flavobacteriaceae bacterium Ap0902]
MENLNQYLDLFQKNLQKHEFQQEPQKLYEPINYILNLGGKRLRPIITLLTCDFFGGDLQEAIKPSLAIEFFHNFTLMHDDIMDKAPLRRGKTTVHEKYTVDSAILSGDALLIKAYQYLEDLPADKFKKVCQIFSEAAIKVCEGQQYDLNFETQEKVTEEEYLQMIYYKTGSLAATAFKIGAVIANASDEDVEHIYNFGKNLGIAFQLKDDLLDVYGDKDLVGKKHAGDIFENKKTILYIKAMELSNTEQKEELTYWYNSQTDNIDKIYSVENIFKALRIDKIVEFEIEKYTRIANEELHEVKGNKMDLSVLEEFNANLIGRSF